MQPAFPFVDISTPVDAAVDDDHAGEPGRAGARLQDRQDVHHHALGRDSSVGLRHPEAGPVAGALPVSCQLLVVSYLQPLPALVQLQTRSVPEGRDFAERAGDALPHALDFVAEEPARALERLARAAGGTRQDRCASSSALPDAMAGIGPRSTSSIMGSESGGG